jgi:hypothetical protein
MPADTLEILEGDEEGRHGETPSKPSWQRSAPTHPRTAWRPSGHSSNWR